MKKSKKIKRYYTALNRIRKSRGFGIHSPFAFRFVLKVLKERLPYYAYERIDACHKEIKAMSKERGIKHPKIMSLKDARMMFRITNFFNPKEILQIGTNYGISTVALLSVSSKSKLHICNIQPSQFDFFAKSTEKMADRINKFSSAEHCIENYSNSADMPFIVINDIDDTSYQYASRLIDKFISSKCTIIVSCICKKELGEAIWEETKSKLTGGMSFSNGKFGVVVCNPKLPVQHFSLWF